MCTDMCQPLLHMLFPIFCGKPDCHLLLLETLLFLFINQGSFVSRKIKVAGYEIYFFGDPFRFCSWCLRKFYLSRRVYCTKEATYELFGSKFYSKKDWNRKCMDGTHYSDIIFSNGVKNSLKCHRLDRNLYSNNSQSDSISLHTNVSHLYTFQIPSPVCYEPHFPKKESAFINSQNDFDFSRRDFIS